MSRSLSILLLMIYLAAPSLALVEPEVEAWQDYAAQVRETFSFTGGEIFGDAADGVGAIASSAVAAPLSEYMSELELRRDLKFKYFTPWHVKTKSQLRQFISTQVAKDYTPEKVDAEEALLKVLGLVAMDFDILEFTETLLTDSVAGAYDPSTDQFFLVDTETGQGLQDRLKVKASRAVLGDMNPIVIVHELDHALGGQHFPLKTTFETLLKDATIDQQMAVMALLEGDATFVMMDHQHKRSPESAGADTTFAGSDMLTDILVSFPLPLPGMGEFGKAPLFFQKSLIFPYYGGAEFVSTLRHYGGSWEEVNRAYRSLPRSTEEILHPYRYLYLQPEADYPDFSEMPDPFGEWKKVKDDTGGEFLVRIVLEQYGVDEYLEAADGWNGDRLRVFRNQKTGALGFYWVIRWDHPYEAHQFYSSLGSHLPFVVEQEELTTMISLAFDEKRLAELRKFWK